MIDLVKRHIQVITIHVRVTTRWLEVLMSRTFWLLNVSNLLNGKKEGSCGPLVVK